MWLWNTNKKPSEIRGQCSSYNNKLSINVKLSYHADIFILSFTQGHTPLAIQACGTEILAARSSTGTQK